MQKPLHFVTGLPRSGTTLLMNLLGQNPAHHVTPTSGLVHLMRHAIERWPTYKEFRAEGLDSVKPRVVSALRGLMYGFYEAQFEAEKTVFDKSRGWLQFVEPVEEILGHRVIMITMVRDVRAIAASFEKIYRSRGIEYRIRQGDEDLAKMSVEGRARRSLSQHHVTGRSILRLRDALARCPDRLLIIPYRKLCEQPQQAVAAIHEALSLPPFTYDPEHVEQVTHEDDMVNGMDLHTIRQKIEPPPAEPWRAYLPDDLASEIAEKFADLNALAAGGIVAPTPRA